MLAGPPSQELLNVLPSGTVTSTEFGPLNPGSIVTRPLGVGTILFLSSEMLSSMTSPVTFSIELSLSLLEPSPSQTIKDIDIESAKQT